MHWYGEEIEMNKQIEAMNAPNLFGQVYLSCRNNGNSHEGSMTAGDKAACDFGDEPVSPQSDLDLIVEMTVRG